jgi:hypothetical protein
LHSSEFETTRGAEACAETSTYMFGTVYRLDGAAEKMSVKLLMLRAD